MGDSLHLWEIVAELKRRESFRNWKREIEASRNFIVFNNSELDCKICLTYKFKYVGCSICRQQICMECGYTVDWCPYCRGKLNLPSLFLGLKKKN